jgi:hypothetical protein
MFNECSKMATCFSMAIKQERPSAEITETGGRLGQVLLINKKFSAAL